MKVKHYSWPRRSGAKPHETAVINTNGGREIQVSESPAGRSIQIHIRDGAKWRKIYP